MGVGNKKTYGNKGDAHPFQHRNLLTLGAISSLLSTANASNAPIGGLAMGLIRATDATGSPIVAGRRRITVANMGVANGLVLGAVIKPGEILSWPAGDLRDTLGALSYDGTGTELVITTVG